jgi:hypothetical protein
MGLTVFCAGTAKSQTEINLSLEPKLDTIVIGDQITLKVSVVSPKNDVIIFPQFGKELTKGIELIDVKEVDTLKSNDDNLRRLERRYLITSFDAGSYHLNQFPLLKITPTGVDTIYSDKEVVINVKTIALDENFQPYDIKTIKTYPSQWWIWIVVIAVAVLTIVGLTLFFVRKYRKTDKAVKLKINPYAWAMYELENLKSSGVSTVRTKEYYSRLTDIIREYIELQTNVAAMEKTSDEILSLLPETVFNADELISHIRNLFSVADLVKFAKYPASTFECETSWDDALQFVTKSNNIVNALKQSENEDSGNIGNTTI